MDRRTRAATRLSAMALIAIVGLVSACTSTSSPASSSTPSTNNNPSQAVSGAPSAAPTATAAATGGSASGTCKFLSDTDAAALLPTAGQAKVTGGDTPAGTVTSCHWGTGNLVSRANVIQLVVDEFKIDAALAAAKASIAENIKQKISGLGDNGGFSEQSSDIIAIQFIKGTKSVILAVAAPGMTADAVAGLAQKVAANL